MDLVEFNVKQYTLVFIRSESRILLGYKKRGFGQGKWNGFGGKVEAGESIEDAAIREVQEECNLLIDKSSLVKFGILTFEFVELNPGKLMEVHVFTSSSFKGEVKESDEMLPKWYETEQIPYDEMWADDKIWFPLFLEGKKVTGKFLFKDYDTLLSHDIIVTN